MIPAPSPTPDEPRLDPRTGLAASFRFAFDGLFRTVLTQRNMKIHWVSGLAVMLVGMALELDLAARAAVLFCVFIVLGMEVLNTALEAFVDLHVKNFRRPAMVAKDAAAAAVLVTAIASVVVFGDVLYHEWALVEASGDAVWRTTTLGVPILALTSAVLWMPRHTGPIAACALLALGLLAALAVHAHDQVFTAVGFALVLGALFARMREPTLRGLVDR